MFQKTYIKKTYDKKKVKYKKMCIKKHTKKKKVKYKKSYAVRLYKKKSLRCMYYHPILFVTYIPC